MNWIKNLNPFYWKDKAERLQDHLDYVAGVRLQQEQKITAITTKWHKAVEDLARVARERDELRDKVPDYSLPEHADLAQYIAEGATPREAKMMLDLYLLKQQVDELGTVCEGKDRLELVKEIHRLETKLSAAEEKNRKWFTTFLGFQPFDGVLMNQALRGKELMIDPIIEELWKDVDGKANDDNT